MESVIQTYATPAPNNTLAPGDTIIIQLGHSELMPVILQTGGFLDNRLGSFSHQDIIGKPVGSIWVAKRTNYRQKHQKKNKQQQQQQQQATLVTYPPTPELWTLALRHRTQILYAPDIALVILELEIHSGSIVIESGTGSASMTMALVRAVAPYGKVYSYDFHQERVQLATKDLHNVVPTMLRGLQVVQDDDPPDIADPHNNANAHAITTEEEVEQTHDHNGLTTTTMVEADSHQFMTQTHPHSNLVSRCQRLPSHPEEVYSIVQVEHRDVVRQGFPEHPDNSVDAVFLDLPNVADAIVHAHRVLKPNAAICGFSPCVEQVDRTCQALVQYGFNRITVQTCRVRPFYTRKLKYKKLNSLDGDDDDQHIYTASGKTTGVKRPFSNRDNHDNHDDNSHDVIDHDPNANHDADDNNDEYLATQPATEIKSHTSYLTFAFKAVQYANSK